MVPIISRKFVHAQPSDFLDSLNSILCTIDRLFEDAPLEIGYSGVER
jgi:hypothetical protein